MNFETVVSTGWRTGIDCKRAGWRSGQGRGDMCGPSVAYPGGVLRVLEHPPKAQGFN